MSYRPTKRLQAPKSWTREAIECTAAWLIKWSSPPTASSQANTLTLVCISDTHGTTPILPEGDLLLHAGGLTINGSFEEVQDQLDWLNRQPHTYKVVIGGNHDFILDGTAYRKSIVHHASIKRCEDLQWGCIIYLQNSSTTLTFPRKGRKLTVFGSPMTPQRGEWAFQYAPIKDVWYDMIPNDIDVLITHGPPKSHLDSNASGTAVGCPYLLRAIHRVRPKVHVFGHIHESYGQKTTRFNAATAAYENIIWLGGGVTQLGRLILAVLTRSPFERRGDTVLVNAAIPDVQATPPIVLEM